MKRIHHVAIPDGWQATKRNGKGTELLVAPGLPESREYAEVQEVLTSSFGGGASSAVSFDETAESFHVLPNRDMRLKQGYQLWKGDPLGGSIVNLTAFFTFGRGLTVSSPDTVTEQVLRKFWKQNRLSRKSKVLCEEGVAFGENFLKLRVHKEDVENPANPDRPLWRRGQVQVIPVDPRHVAAVEHDPANIDDVEHYVVRYAFEEQDREKVVEEKIPSLEKFNPDSDDAAMVHLKFNAASNDLFGTSDLVRLREWLVNYKEFLRDSVVINKLYRSPCFDITIKDGDEAEVKKAIRRYEGWTIGSNPVHNDKEEWKILEFSGANVSASESRRALLLIVAAGSNLPEYMLADGSNSNLASAKAQQLPAVKKFEDRQESYRSLWTEVFEFVLDMADQLGEVSDLEPELDFEGDPMWKVEVRFPPISLEEDRDLTEANRTAIEDGYMSPQTAAARMGLDFEHETNLRIESQKESEIMNLELERFRQSEDFLALKAETLGTEGGPPEADPGLNGAPPPPPPPAPPVDPPPPPPGDDVTLDAGVEA